MEEDGLKELNATEFAETREIWQQLETVLKCIPSEGDEFCNNNNNNTCTITEINDNEASRLEHEKSIEFATPVSAVSHDDIQLKENECDIPSNDNIPTNQEIFTQEYDTTNGVLIQNNVTDKISDSENDDKSKTSCPENDTSNENHLDDCNCNTKPVISAGSLKDLLPDISSLLDPENDMTTLTADITAALDNCKSPDSDFDKDSPLDILNLCSTTAQHLKDTINQVLQSRDTPKEGSLSEVRQIKLENNIKEKIAELEESFTSTSNVKENENQKYNEKSLSVLKQLPNQANSIEVTGNMPLVENDNNENREKEKLTNSVDQEENIALTKEKSIIGHKSLSKIQDNADLKHNNIVPCSDEQEDKPQKKPPKACNSGKRKGERNIDQLTKYLSNYCSTEDKFQALYKKHLEVLEEQRSLESRLKQTDRYNIQLTREKEQLQADHNRAVLAKSKLEGLCRELQRQNKAIKEESLIRIREEEENKKELVGKFQTTLNDITALMQENQQRSSQLKDENLELAQKLKSLVDHYDMWEKHMGKVVRQKELESQLAKAKLAKTGLQLKQERENFLKEKHQLLENVNELQKRSTELAATEFQLRNELSVYTSKYDEFQGVLQKSNDVFSSFKIDMETMSKKIKKLQKETSQWKTRWENSNRALIEMASEKQKRDQELLLSQQRVLTLEKLCRAMQTERIELQTQLKNQHQQNEEQCENKEKIIQSEPATVLMKPELINEEPHT